MSACIFVLAEHRRGALRDITFEMLAKASALAEPMDAEVVAVLLGYETKELAETLLSHADKVFVIEDERLANFNSEYYQEVLSRLTNLHKPLLTMLGQTSFGMDLAPNLATSAGIALAADCIDVRYDNGKLTALRQIYGGKVNASTVFVGSDGYMVTMRPAAFAFDEHGTKSGTLVNIDSPLSADIEYKKFIEYVEAAAGEVDITQADVIVAVGRGIKEQENLKLVEALAESLGGVLACSRPIIDKQWLPQERQVGTSGRTVKPKLYIAVGISGAFQHVAGMKASDTIVAINKDANAPIFEAAHFGIIGDLFKVVPILTERVRELRGG